MGNGIKDAPTAPLARAELRLHCGSPREAHVLWEAVSVDDPGSIEGRVVGDDLVVRVGPLPAPSLRITMDDLLACIQAASGSTIAEELVRDEEVG